MNGKTNLQETTAQLLTKNGSQRRITDEQGSCR